jgi:hypothetical protein
MKVYVYYEKSSNQTFCHLTEQLLETYKLMQVIECEETIDPITSFADPILIGIGEVFGCNNSTANLIRIA